MAVFSVYLYLLLIFIALIDSNICQEVINEENNQLTGEEIAVADLIMNTINASKGEPSQTIPVEAGKIESVQDDIELHQLDDEALDETIEESTSTLTNNHSTSTSSNTAVEEINEDDLDVWTLFKMQIQRDFAFMSIIIPKPIQRVIIQQFQITSKSLLGITAGLVSPMGKTLIRMLKLSSQGLMQCAMLLENQLHHFELNKQQSEQRIPQQSTISSSSQISSHVSSSPQADQGIETVVASSNESDSIEEGEAYEEAAEVESSVSIDSNDVIDPIDIDTEETDEIVLEV